MAPDDGQAFRKHHSREAAIKLLVLARLWREAERQIRTQCPEVQSREQCLGYEAGVYSNSEGSTLVLEKIRASPVLRSDSDLKANTLRPGL